MHFFEREEKTKNETNLLAKDAESSFLIDITSSKITAK